MPGTNIISRIAIHATAETALPTLADLGSNITQAVWSTAGFETLGGRSSRGDDFDFDEEDVDVISVDPRYADISAPLSDGTDARHIISRKLNDIEFMLYDIDPILLGMDSAIDVTSEVVTWADPTTPTYRAVAVEIFGEGIFSFPKCFVTLESIGGSMVDGGAARTKLTIKPINTTSLPNGGWNYSKYQAGA
jgi:hypothetical protein